MVCFQFDIYYFYYSFEGLVTRANISPDLYEGAHVPLLRMCVEFFIGDGVSSVSNINDLNKVIAMYVPTNTSKDTPSSAASNATNTNLGTWNNDWESGGVNGIIGSVGGIVSTSLVRRGLCFVDVAGYTGKRRLLTPAKYARSNLNTRSGRRSSYSSFSNGIEKKSTKRVLDISVLDGFALGWEAKIRSDKINDDGEEDMVQFFVFLIINVGISSSFKKIRGIRAR